MTTTNDTNLPIITFFDSKGTRYVLLPFYGVVADDGSLFRGNYLVSPNQKIYTEAGDTLFWNGSGIDKDDKSFTLKSVEEHHVRAYLRSLSAQSKLM